jgi:hypothetical protein
MEKYYRYNVKKFKTKLQIRFSIVLVLFSIFLVWNFLQIPGADRKEFLTLFLPMSALLGLFLYRSFKRQIAMLEDVSVSIDGRILRQYNKTEEAGEYDLAGLEKIFTDTYRSYPRVILEWDDRALSFVNLENVDLFVAEIQKITKLEPEVFPNTESIISLRAIPYLAPSVIYFCVVLYFESKAIQYLNWETFFLFFNMNLIIYVLYGTGKDAEKYSEVYQNRRKILFVLLVIFIYQVFTQFSSSLGLF